MKRVVDYDEYGQSIPKRKKLSGIQTQRVLHLGYVTQEEFEQMQTELKEQLEEQTTVLEQALLELKQIKLHLASLSGESVESTDIEE